MGKTIKITFDETKSVEVEKNYIVDNFLSKDDNMGYSIVKTHLDGSHPFMKNIKLEKAENDYFREWIIKEWKHHNTVDPIYQLVIKKPSEVKFQKNEEYFKIIYDKKKVGFVGIKTYEKEINLFRLFIDEDYRNQGIGSYVVQWIIEMAKKQKKDVSLEVMGNNHVAKQIYEKYGFKTHYTKMVLKINDDLYKEVD